MNEMPKNNLILHNFDFNTLDRRPKHRLIFNL